MLLLPYRINVFDRDVAHYRDVTHYQAVTHWKIET